MTSFEKSVHEKYENADEIITLVKKYNLIDKINKAFYVIEKKVQEGKTDELPKISGLILHDINSGISVISDVNHKNQIMYLLADAFQDFLKLVSSGPNAQSVLTEISISLMETSTFHGYNFNELAGFLNLPKYQLLPSKPVIEPIYYYWNGKEEELSELSKDLYSKNIIYSVKEFKQLFRPIKGNLAVRCNPSSLDKLIVLFQILKEYQLITPKGKGNSGHFAPFVRYSVDKEGTVFIKKKINKLHESLKRNSVKYLEIRSEMEYLITQNVNIKMRQR